MKKFLALILAGVMVVSMSVMVFAEGESDSVDDMSDQDSANGEFVEDSAVDTGSDSGYKEPSEYTTSAEDLEYIYNMYIKDAPSFSWDEFASWSYPDDVKEALYKTYGPGSGNSGDSSSSAPSGSPASGGSSSSNGGEEVIYDRGSEAEALAIQATGIPMATTLAAAEENKSVGEYMNNAVVAAPGLENAVPVSQGGSVIINGQPSNQTFSVLKVLSGHTDAAKAQAAAIGGRVLNVARIDASVYFDTATVNFYMPGVTAGQNIQVYQYDYANGQWISVVVAEVREDHVVVDMTSLGVLAFFEVLAAE